MTITGGSALSKEEIDKMIHDAEQYADEDRKRRESVELRNQADSAVYTTEKFLADNADKIPGDVRSDVEADVAALKKALEGEDDDALKTAVAKLSESSQKMGAAMYASASQESGDGDGASATGQPTDAATDAATDPATDEGDVVDAEIVDEGESGDGTSGQQ
jgi:molecular chaperone DnaK